ncbi:MAG: SsgA family sporulation/cell division regulator [Nocardioides sp.]|nr:SsgA family sporulation/cell division regulator [Nocardioides sp.]
MNIFEIGPVLSDVALDITVECIDDRGIHHRLDAVLDYRRSDPFAIAMTFITGAGDLVWTFGRDLLSHGIVSPVGEGDVHVAPAIGLSGTAMVSIELTSPDGHLVLQALTTDVTEFLARSFAVVPDGAESDHFDVDSLISQVLAA